MSNTYTLLRFIRSACMSAGMFTLIVAGKQQSWAQELEAVTNQGAVLKAADFHAAAYVPAQGSPIIVQLIVGALLLFAGFALHALYVTRKDHSVPVHAAKKSKRSQLNVYWMNMRIR